MVLRCDGECLTAQATSWASLCEILDKVQLQLTTKTLAPITQPANHETDLCCVPGHRKPNQPNDKIPPLELIDEQSCGLRMRLLNKFS